MSRGIELRSLIVSLRHHVLDVLIVGLFALAGFIQLQPGSWLRERWTAHRAEARVEGAARTHWPELKLMSTPLYHGSGSPEVVEIGDYECPFCRLSEAAVDSAVRSGVRVSFLNLPETIHLHARGAALAAICARKVGAFASMHEHLMTTSAWQGDSDWASIARTSGISDTSQFTACTRAAETASTLARELELDQQLNVRGTPTFVTSGAIHEGVITFQELRALNAAN